MKLTLWLLAGALFLCTAPQLWRGDKRLRRRLLNHCVRRPVDRDGQPDGGSAGKSGAVFYILQGKWAWNLPSVRYRWILDNV